METQELLLTAGRAVVVYFFMLVVIRLLGKRSVGAFSAFDLLVALMLGEVVDEMIYGDVTLLQGGVAVAAIALCQFGTECLGYKSKRLDELLQGKPSILVRDGQLQHHAMRAERMSEQDVMVQLRQQSMDDIREVKLAILEPSGQVSVIKQDWAETVRKADLGGPEQQQREQATQGQKDPPADKSPISPKMLQQEAA
jgi:uncharacterized membrane protein YcaP (DUF421 family)